jgi:hypothetical protein
LKEKDEILKDYPANLYPKLYEKEGNLKDVGLVDLCRYVRILSQESPFDSTYSKEEVEKIIHQ